MVKRWLNRLGEEDFRLLLEMKRADICGQAPHLAYRLEEIDALNATLEKILTEKQCFTLKELAVNGHDLITIGLYPGKLLGDILQALLSDVIENKLPNDKNRLLDRAQELKENRSY